MKPYAVAKEAHQRGYGSCHEIVALGDRRRTPATSEAIGPGKFRRRKTS
jgi:hypothetical protein